MSTRKRIINYRRAEITGLGTYSAEVETLEEILRNEIADVQSFPVVKTHSSGDKIALVLTSENKFFEHEDCLCAWLTRYNEHDRVQLTGEEQEHIICEAVTPQNDAGIKRNVEKHSIAFVIKGNHIAYISNTQNADKILQEFIQGKFFQKGVNTLLHISLYPVVSNTILSAIDIAKGITYADIKSKGYGMYTVLDKEKESENSNSNSWFNGILESFGVVSQQQRCMLNSPTLDMAHVRANLQLKCLAKTQRDTKVFISQIAIIAAQSDELDTVIYLKNGSKIDREQLIVSDFIRIRTSELSQNGENRYRYMQETAKFLTKRLKEGTIT